MALEDRTVPSTFTVLNLNDGGAGSLRQAVLDANDNPGPDLIRFRGGLSGTIALTTGQLSLTDAVAVHGPGAGRLAVSGTDASRVFHVAGGVEATVSGLTITRGKADKLAPAVPCAGGGVLNQGTLTLSNVVVSDNRAVGDAGVVLSIGGYVLFGTALGGGVANLGKVTVAGTSFVGNQALGADGTVGLDFPNIVFPGMALGGGLYNLLDTAAVTGSRFVNNVARGGSDCVGAFGALGGGAAIYNDSALTVAGSLFHGNRAFGGDDSVADIHPGHGLGGAIISGSVQALFGARSATLDVSGSTFTNNEALGGDDNRVYDPALVALLDGPSNGFGGAVVAYQGSAAISRSTFLGNRAVGGAGGGDQKGSLGGGGAVLFINFIGGVTGSLTSSTVVGNEAIGGSGRPGIRGGDALGGGVLMGGLGSLFGGPGTVAIGRSVVALNLARGGAGGSGADGGDGLGGGLFNDESSTLTLTNSVVTLNRAWGGAAGAGGSAGKGIGGGLYNLGVYSDVLTLILGNDASTSDDNVFG